MAIFHIKCRCGKSEMAFNKNIGDFFINDCCLEDFDQMGNPLKKEEIKEVEVKEEIKEVEVKEEAKSRKAKKSE